MAASRLDFPRSLSSTSSVRRSRSNSHAPLSGPKPSARSARILTGASAAGCRRVSLADLLRARGAGNVGGELVRAAAIQLHVLDLDERLAESVLDPHFERAVSAGFAGVDRDRGSGIRQLDAAALLAARDQTRGRVIMP